MFSTTGIVVLIEYRVLFLLIAQLFFEITLSCFCKLCMLVIIENTLPVPQEYYHLNFLQSNQRMLNLKIDAILLISLFIPSK